MQRWLLRRRSNDSFYVLHTMPVHTRSTVLPPSMRTGLPFDTYLLLAVLRALEAEYVQGGKKSLSVAVVDEFCILDLMEVHVENLLQNWLLNFKIFALFSKILHCILLMTKLFQRTIGYNLIVLLTNGKNVSWSFNTTDAWILTATLWFWTRGCLFYTQ